MTESRLWQVLDTIPGLTAARAEWQRLLGDQFDSCASYLRPTGEIAQSLPRVNEPAYRVVCHGPDDYVGVCPEGGPTIPLSREGLLLYEVHQRELAGAVASALKLDQRCEAISGIANAWALGRSQQPGRMQLPVFMAFRTEDDEYRSVSLELQERHRTGFILLIPTWRVNGVDSERTFALQSLFKIASDGALAPMWRGADWTANRSSSAILPDNIFRRCGGGWQVRFNGQKVFTVLPWLGASYIHYLLVSPNEPRPAIDIVCSTVIDFCDQAISAKQAIDEGLRSSANPLLASLGAVSDWRAITQYREKARELLLAVEQARAENNSVLVQQYENDMKMVVAKINEAIKPGGKLRQAGDKRKNIRDSFRNNVKRLIEKQILETDPDLAKHFEESLHFGNTPSYIPKSPVTWELEAVVNTPQ